MKKQLSLALFVALLFISCESSKPQMAGKGISHIVNSFSENNGGTGTIVLIEKNNKTATYTAGYANFEKKTTVNKNDLFEIGSTSKIFTAIAIMQLVERGELSLDTKLKSIYPTGNITNLANHKGQNYWGDVTIKMLLNHTSGFVDYLNTFGDEEQSLKALNNSTKEFSFEEIINIAVDAGDAGFMPEEQFEYSNTNYIILGDIISKKSQTDWRTYIEKNIFERLGLENTFFGSRISAKEKERLMTGYYAKQVTQIPYSLAGAAGEIISDIYDLRKFLLGWANGNLYQNPQTFEEQITLGMQSMEPGTDILIYAFGTMRIANKVVGHGGRTFGFQTYVGVNEETKNIYIVAANSASIDTFSLYLELINEPANELMDKN